MTGILMQKLHIETPILYSEALSRHVGTEIYLKLDNLQPSGSFKNRGMGHVCSFLADEGAKGFVIASGGNAGLAVGYSGRKLGLPVKVVVSNATLPLMHKKIESEGAECIIHGNHFSEARAYAEELARELNWPCISPYDHPRTWEGNSSIIDELISEKVVPDAIVAAVGGGGLLCGLIQGLKRHNLSGVPIITAETTGAAKMGASLKAGVPVRLEKPVSIATSICMPVFSERMFDQMKDYPLIPEVVTDDQAARACYEFCNDHRLIVEPACGAALAVAYEKRECLKQFSKVVIEVCGGVVVSPEMLLKWTGKTL